VDQVVRLDRLPGDPQEPAFPALGGLGGAGRGSAGSPRIGCTARPAWTAESKVEDAIKKAITRAEKQTAKELGVNPKDIDKTLQETVKEM